MSFADRHFIANTMLAGAQVFLKVLGQTALAYAFRGKASRVRTRERLDGNEAAT